MKPLEAYDGQILNCHIASTRVHLTMCTKAAKPTLAVVSPLYSVYRWCTAPSEQLQGWAIMRNRWKWWPSLSAVSNIVPLGSKFMAATGSETWAGKWAIMPSPSESSCRVTCGGKIHITDWPTSRIGHRWSLKSKAQVSDLKTYLTLPYPLRIQNSNNARSKCVSQFWGSFLLLRTGMLCLGTSQTAGYRLTKHCQAFGQGLQTWSRAYCQQHWQSNQRFPVPSLKMCMSMGEGLVLTLAALMTVAA